MKKRVFNLIIVDESGSMSCIERQTVSGLNETLQTIRQVQKENPEQEHLATVIFFSSSEVRTLYNAVPAEKAEDISAKDFNPNSCTPLYDAIGNGITNLRCHVAPEDSVLVTIITDGEENASKEYDHAAVHTLIKNMQKQDWVFTFIGANIDVDRTSKGLGINFCMKFEQSDEGTRAMFAKERKSRSIFFSKLSRFMCEEDDEPCSISKIAEKDGYFNA